MSSVMQIARRGVLALALGLCSAFGAQADDWRSTDTIFGTPGLIEMPSVGMTLDGEIGVALGGFSLQQVGSFTFQIAPPNLPAKFARHWPMFWSATGSFLIARKSPTGGWASAIPARAIAPKPQRLAVAHAF